jgi:hypothetical protein
MHFASPSSMLTCPGCLITLEFIILVIYGEEHKLWNFSLCGSRDNVVGIATGYWLDDQGVEIRVPVGSRIFSSPCCPDRVWGPPNLLSNVYRGALSPGVKRQRREADHSPPANEEVKKTWIYTSTPPPTFMA